MLRPPMRIAVFAKSNARTQTTRSIARALARAGHTLCVIRDAQRRPPAGRRPAHRRAAAGLAGRIPTVMFTPDCWTSPIAAQDLGLAAHVDLLCTVARGQVAEFERAGVKRAAYLAEAHDPELYYPVESAAAELRSEVAFI